MRKHPYAHTPQYEQAREVRSYHNHERYPGESDDSPLERLLDDAAFDRDPENDHHARARSARWAYTNRARRGGH